MTLCLLIFCVFTNNVIAEDINNNVANGPIITNNIILRKPYDNPVMWLKFSRIRMQMLHTISQLFTISIISFFCFYFNLYLFLFKSTIWKPH